MKMKLCYLIFLFSSLLMAQINESDTLNFKADLSVTGFWQGGNVKTKIFRATSGMSFKPWPKWVFKTQNSYVFQEFGGDKADSDFLSLNFLYIHPEQRIYPLLLGFVSTNYRREIEMRSIYGAGVTYQIIDKKKNKNNNWLKMSISGEYEHTQFKRADFNLIEYNQTKNINTFRSTIWINGYYNLFKNKVILKHEMYLQPSLEKRNNYRWRTDLAIEIPIWKHLNFKINYLRTYENIVIQGQEQKDDILTFGFTLKNY